MTEVDLFVSTQRIKVLTADTQVRRNGNAHVALGLLRPSRPPWDLLCLPTPVGSCTGMAHGRGRAAGRRRVTPQPSHTRVPCIPRLAAWLHEASHANYASREQTELQGSWS